MTKSGLVALAAIVAILTICNLTEVSIGTDEWTVYLGNGGWHPEATRTWWADSYNWKDDRWEHYSSSPSGHGMHCDKYWDPLPDLDWIYYYVHTGEGVKPGSLKIGVYFRADTIPFFNNGPDLWAWNYAESKWVRIKRSMGSPSSYVWKWYSVSNDYLNPGDPGGVYFCIGTAGGCHTMLDSVGLKFIAPDEEIHTVTYTLRDKNGDGYYDGITVKMNADVGDPGGGTTVEVTAVVKLVGTFVRLSADRTWTITDWQEEYPPEVTFYPGVNGKYTVHITLYDEYGNNESYTHESVYLSPQGNLPPNPPSNPSPANGATRVSINPTLSWSCSDPDGDPLTYDIYFGTGTDPPLVKSDHPSNSYSPGTLSYSTTYYWKIVAKDDHGHSTSSPVWHFRTRSPPPLVADADGPYSGGAGFPVQFYGSASGGIPPYTFHWDFGDGATSNQQNPTHTYNPTAPTTYTVTLTVTDSAGHTDTDTTTAHICVLPEVTTLGATDLYETRVTLNGRIDYDGGASCQIKFRYREAGTTSWVEVGSWSGSYNTGETFSVLLEGLRGGKTYEFQAGAKNQAGIVWGNTEEFTTPTDVVLIVPTVYPDRTGSPWNDVFTQQRINYIRNLYDDVCEYFFQQSFGKIIIRFEEYQHDGSNALTMRNWIDSQGNPNYPDGIPTDDAHIPAYTPPHDYVEEIRQAIRDDPNYDLSDYSAIIAFQICPDPRPFRDATYPTNPPVVVCNIDRTNVQLSTIWQVVAHELGHAICKFDDFYYFPGQTTRGNIEWWGMMGGYPATARLLELPVAPFFCFNKLLMDWLTEDRRINIQYFDEKIKNYSDLELDDTIYVIEHDDTNDNNDVIYYLEARYGLLASRNVGGVNIYRDHKNFIELVHNGCPAIIISGSEYGYEPTIVIDNTMPERSWYWDALTGLNFTYHGDDDGGIFDPRVTVKYEVSKAANTYGVIASAGGGDYNPSDIYMPPKTLRYVDLDLHAYTSDGKHVGMNYTTGQYECEIPGAIYSGNNLHEEYILVPKGTEVYFQVALNGNFQGAFNYTTRIVDVGEEPSIDILPDGTIEYHDYYRSEMVLRNLTVGNHTEDLDGDGIPFYQDPNPNDGPVFSLYLNVTLEPEVYIVEPTLGSHSIPIIINVRAGEIPISNANIQMSCTDNNVTFSSVQEIGNGRYSVIAFVPGPIDIQYTEIVRATASKPGFINGSGEMMITTDNTPPVTNKTVGTPQYGENATWVTSSTEFNLTAIDDISGVNATYYRIWYNGSWSNWIKYTGNFTLQGEGKHYLEYYSIDNARNVENVTNQTHYVDLSPPVTSLSYGSPYYTNGIEDWITTSTPITLSTVDYPECACGVMVTYYRINGGDWNLYTHPFTINEECKHTIEFYSVDYLGNEEDHHTVTVNVDSSPPETTLAYGSPYYTNGAEEWIATSTLIYLNASDLPECGCGINHTYYRIDNGKWIEYTKPFTIGKECSHIIEYYSVDHLGNIEDRHVIKINVDSSPPRTTIDFGPPSYKTEGETWISSSTPIYLSSSDYPICTDEIDKINHQVSGGCGVNKTFYRVYKEGEKPPEFSAYTGPFSIDEGRTHIIEFHSIDNLGNIERVRTKVVKVDNSPPETNLTIGDPHVYKGNSLFVTSHTPFKFTSNDTGECAVGVKNIWYRVWSIQTGWSDWMIYNPIISTTEGIPIIDGEGLHYVEYYSTDLVDNAESIHNLTCYTDNTPPKSMAHCIYPRYIYIEAQDIGDGDTEPAVGGYRIHYRYKIGDENWTDWQVGGENEYIVIRLSWPDNTAPIDIPIHVEYYAVDALGNTENTHHDVFTVQRS